MSEASWQTRSRVRLLVAALTACIACAVVAAATAGDGGGTVATDLQNPRGIAAGPGKQLLVVESATGAVDVVRHGRTRTIATVPGAVDVAANKHSTYVVVGDPRRMRRRRRRDPSRQAWSASDMTVRPR